MSRVARDFSWHMFAFVIVVAGRSILAPVVWWQARPVPHAARIERGIRAQHTDDGALRRSDEISISKSTLDQPQVAPVGPLIADDIKLDPAVNETPALPVGRADRNDDPLQVEATGDLQ